MSLLSKFLKDEGAKALENVGKDLLAKALGDQTRQPAAQPAPAPAAPAQSDYDPDDPWDVMPAEENQYSYNGHYTAYFSGIFASEFPAYNVTQESVNGGRATVYTFLQGGSKALVVELMSERSEANRLRTECKRAGVPYVRFYYDHQGWWNTRSYVVNRVREALGA